MDLVQADFVGNARVYSDESSNREFERIFGFSPSANTRCGSNGASQLYGVG